MRTRIESWLEAKTGDTRRQMALTIGETPSTFYRNIESAEVIVAVCRAYGINPVDGLVAGGILEGSEIVAAASSIKLESVPERELLEEVLRRVTQRENNGLIEPLSMFDELNTPSSP